LVDLRKERAEILPGHDEIPPEGVKEMTDEEFWERCNRTLPDGSHRSGVRQGHVWYTDSTRTKEPK